MFVIPFPIIDPIAVSFGPLSLRWYGLAYMAGLLIGWLYARKLISCKRLWAAKTSITPAHIDDLLLWATLGVVLGGRLGYVLLYNPAYYMANPADIIAVWNGGMSFHGGLVGTALAIYIFSRKHKLPLMSLLDVASAVAPVGIFFGRLANFINGELWGRATEVPWAMVFPHPDAGELARHPSQLYEAALEGLLLFGILQLLIYRQAALLKPGLVSGVFIAGYGLARIFAENFRQFESDVGIMIAQLTPGMLYSIPLVIAGIYIARRARNQP
jgi:phosphatidylglycerol:prolipoprotein diacylglycerol transferase